MARGPHWGGFPLAVSVGLQFPYLQNGGGGWSLGHPQDPLFPSARWSESPSCTCCKIALPGPTPSLHLGCCPTPAHPCQTSEEPESEGSRSLSSVYLQEINPESMLMCLLVCAVCAVHTGVCWHVLCVLYMLVCAGCAVCWQVLCVLTLCMLLCAVCVYVLGDREGTRCVSVCVCVSSHRSDWQQTRIKSGARGGRGDRWASPQGRGGVCERAWDPHRESGQRTCLWVGAGTCVCLAACGFVCASVCSRARRPPLGPVQEQEQMSWRQVEALVSRPAPRLPFPFHPP